MCELMPFVSLHSTSTLQGSSTGCVNSDLPDLKVLGGAVRLFSSFTLNAILVDSHTASFVVSVCGLSLYLKTGGLVFVLEDGLDNKGCVFSQ